MTHDEECGIAKYQEQYLAGMQGVEDVEHAIFEYSPNKTKLMSEDEFRPVLKHFSGQIKDFNILHIQHEFSFFRNDELDKIVSEALRQRKKVIITVHTSLDAGLKITPSGGFGPRSMLHRLRMKRRRSRFYKTHVSAMRKADFLLVHNTVTAKSLMEHGIPQDRIVKITMPVPNLSFDLATTEVSEHLDKKDDDIIYCTVGFLSENKGMIDAVKALPFLPEKYKLALIGGAHPTGDNDKFYNELCDTIIDLNVQHRVYITGYVRDDERLNALIRECDICVYPFDKIYYAGVTSASLNNSLANHKPAVAYPTDSIVEMNQTRPAVALCDSFTYYELARQIQSLDLDKQTGISKEYADAYSYDKEAVKFADLYRQLVIKDN